MTPEEFEITVVLIIIVTLFVIQDIIFHDDNEKE